MTYLPIATDLARRAAERAARAEGPRAERPSAERADALALRPRAALARALHRLAARIEPAGLR